MGNNPSRPNGPHSRSHQPQERAFPKRSYTTRGRGKYDRYEYDHEDREGDYPLVHPYSAFPGMGSMPPQGYYVHPHYMVQNGDLIFPQPQMQPGLNPVVPHMPMDGAIPITGKPFPLGPMNMPGPKYDMPGAGVEGPVIPPIPSLRGRAGTPYHPSHRIDDSPSSDEYTDHLDAETRERLQPPLAPGQYGPHDPVRDRMRTPAPALRRTHHRVQSSPVFAREPSPLYDDRHEPPVIPQNIGGGPPFPQFPGGGNFVQPEMGGMGPAMPMPEPEVIRPRRFSPIPRRDNPLPPPPRDILQSSPYAKLMRELRKPINESAILAGAPAIHTVGAVNVTAPFPPHAHHGTRSSKEKKRKGLFRSLSNRLGPRRHEEDELESPPSAPPATTLIGGQSTAVYPIVQHLPDGSTQLIYNPPGVHGMPAAAAPAPPPGVMPGYVPAVNAAVGGGLNPPPPVIPGATVPVIPSGTVIPPGRTPTPVPRVQVASPGPMRMPTPQPQSQPHPHPPSPIPHPVPPVIRITRNSEWADLLLFSPHRVHYQHRSWPTGMHLLEAFRFPPERTDLTERIRGCGTAEEAVAIADSLNQFWRRDWDAIALDKIEEVLYYKMVQHPNLRALLMQTGNSDLVFSDPDTTWGDGQIGQGLNLLGHALMTVRQRLREEGLEY